MMWSHCHSLREERGFSGSQARCRFIPVCIINECQQWDKWSKLFVGGKSIFEKTKQNNNATTLNSVLKRRLSRDQNIRGLPIISKSIEIAIHFSWKQVLQENGTQSYCIRYFLNPCDTSIEKMSGNIMICSHLFFFKIWDNKALISHLEILEIICSSGGKQSEQQLSYNFH